VCLPSHSSKDLPFAGGVVDDRGQPIDIANHELSVSLFDDTDLCKVIEFPQSWLIGQTNRSLFL
jgi:hypothetical protein